MNGNALLRLTVLIPVPDTIKRIHQDNNKKHMILQTYDTTTIRMLGERQRRAEYYYY